MVKHSCKSLINLSVVIMQITKFISLTTPIHSLFKEILTYLNANPHINHVTLVNKSLSHAVSEEKDEELLLEMIAERLAENIQYSIDPPPIIDCQFQSLTEHTPPTEKKAHSVPVVAAKSQEKRLLTETDLLVVSIDFDGCSDTPNGKQHIINDIVNLTYQSPSITQIVVIIGSLRQSLACDYLNALNNAAFHNGTLMSCRELGTHFIEQLRAALFARDTSMAPPTVEFDPLMISDLLNDLEIGKTYKALHKFHEKLQSLDSLKQFIIESTRKTYVDLLGYSTHSHVSHALEWNDVSKLSTVLVQMHHMLQKYTETTGQKIHFRFYDDRSDILEPLYHYLKEWQLVPQKMTFDCAKNTGKIFDIPFAPIHGTANITIDYKKTLLYFAQRLPDPGSCPELGKTLVSLYQAYLVNHQLAPTFSSIHPHPEHNTSVLKHEHSDAPIAAETPACSVPVLVKPLARKVVAYTANFFKHPMPFENQENTSYQCAVPDVTGLMSKMS